MSGVIVQKVWKVGNALVVTIPREARKKIPELSNGSYVQIYIEEDRLVIEPVELRGEKE